MDLDAYVYNLELALAKLVKSDVLCNLRDELLEVQLVQLLGDLLDIGVAYILELIEQALDAIHIAHKILRKRCPLSAL